MDIRFQLKNKISNCFIIYTCIYISNSVFGNNFASMVSENFIMKNMMVHYLFFVDAGVFKIVF